jgi:hypothetical protein
MEVVSPVVFCVPAGSMSPAIKAGLTRSTIQYCRADEITSSHSCRAATGQFLEPVIPGERMRDIVANLLLYFAPDDPASFQRMEKG